jgi:phosphoglycolate phosphatase
MDKANRKLMQIENIIFDLDGTLVDSLPGIEYACRYAVDAVCPDRGSFKLQPYIGPPIRDVFRRIFPDIEGNELESLVKEFRKAYDNAGWKKSLLFNGVKTALIELENLNILNYLVTSKPKLPTEKILDFLNVRHCFTEIICPDSMTPNFQSKSDAITYLIAKHGLNHEKVLSVGDTILDQEVATTCGIKFAAADYGYGHFENDSVCINFRISKMPDIVKIIQKGNA